jgi:hypothetical protein
MEICNLSLKAKSNGDELALNFYFDGKFLGTMSPGQDFKLFSHEFEDQGSNHVFEIEMHGKLPKHTRLDTHGAIVEDQVIEIVDVALDDISLGQLLYEKCRYRHDHNGTTQPVETAFYGTMGCNGRVVLEFSSPVYQWLLENM